MKENLLNGGALLRMKQLRQLPKAKIFLTDTRRWTNKVIKKTDWIAFDTETFQGKCKLICDSENRFLYNPNFDEVLKFLCFKANKNLYRAFWNIDFDVSSILKLWNDIETIDKLIHGNKVSYEKYELYYIRPKLLKIKYGHTSLYFIDLFSMYHKSLNSASKEFLNEQKLKDVDAEKLNTDILYWIENLKDIIKYCKKDALLTKKLGNYISNQVLEANLLLPKFFTSHASLSKQYFRYNCRIPSIKHIPLNILDIAFETYYGGRFELLKKGFFEYLISYDINSAYPSVIRELPSLKYGNWIKVKKINKNECIGFYKVHVKIPELYVSPLPLRLKGNTVVYPTGNYVLWITWYEADLLRKYIHRIAYGYEYIPLNREYYPFRKGVDYLYELKLSNKEINEVFYWLFKLVLNALYGCFLERHRKPDGNIYSGILFNPIYASIICAKVRWQLLKIIPKKYLKYIVAFHTDSILSMKDLKINLGNKIGQWSKELEGSGVILKTGIYQIGDIVKRRCFGLKSINWFDSLKEFGVKDYVLIKKKRALKIAESLKRFHNIDDVNIFYEAERCLYINSGKKRVWFDKFKDCNDLLSRHIDSKPHRFYGIKTEGLK